jgi:hypothetical protein
VLNQRRVLYAGKTSDISQAVIALLDSKYRGEGAVGAAGGTGGGAGGGAPATTSTGGDARPAAADGRPAPSDAGAGGPRRSTNR